MDRDSGLMIYISIGVQVKYGLFGVVSSGEIINLKIYDATIYGVQE